MPGESITYAASYPQITIGRGSSITYTEVPYSGANSSFETIKFITTKDLEYYFAEIYKIIKAHTNLDITEEEFIALLNV